MIKLSCLGALTERGSHFTRDLVVEGAFSQVVMERARGLKGLHLHTRSTGAEESVQLSNAVTWRNYLAGMWDKGYNGPRLLGKQNEVPIRRASGEWSGERR